MINTALTVVIILYSLSFVLYMMEAVKKNRPYGRWGYTLLFIGALIQTIIFIYNLMRDYFPLITFYDVLFFYSYIFMLISILLSKIAKLKISKLITVFIGLGLLASAVTIGELTPSISKAFLSNLLIVHISFSLVSYSAFLLCAIFSVMLLIHDYLIRNKINNQLGRLLPSLESLNKNARYASLFGVVSLLIGLMIGSFWASFFYNWRLYFDPKVLTSFVIVLVYVYGLFHSLKGNWGHIQTAIWFSLAFVLVVMNILITNLLESFHQWF